MKREVFEHLTQELLKYKFSLSQVLKNTPEVKERFLKEFPKPYNAKRPKDIKAKPLTKNYGNVGIAFGYVLDFILKKLNSNVIEFDWAAESSLKEIKRIYPKYFEQAKNIVSKTKKLEKYYIKTGEFSDELLKYILLISRLNRYIHSGHFSENLEKYDEGDIEDLRNLIDAVDLNLFKTSEICILNPKFNYEKDDSDKTKLLREIIEDLKLDNLEKHLPGAEPDLIINDLMIDVKTTIDSKFKREFLNQLLGYYIYYRLFGLKGYPPDKQIKRIGIYFSRYGYLSEYNVEDIINETSFLEICEWFIKKIYIS
ncbi:MAG: hypothetical protein P8Y70_06520 [Candidatus Lokiarchaeota archaeon]